MTWGIRRIVFTIGAILLVGGWGVTGYVDAYQHAAGAAAGERWRDGEQAPTATIRTARSPDTDSVAGAPAGTESTPRRISSRPRAAAGAAVLRRVTPPSSWLYGFGVLVMMGGAGLMALTVPWRGARMTPVAEPAPQQQYVSPPPPKMSSETAPPPPPPAAAAFPGVPPLQAAQDVASAPLQSPMQQPAAKGGKAGKRGMKPLQYKKGA